MNWLLGIVVLFIAMFCLRGWKIGIIKSIFMLCSTILALVITSLCNPVVSNILCSNQEIVSMTSKIVSDITGIEKDEKAKQGTIESNKKTQNKAIEQLSLPEIIKNQLIQNNTKEVYQNLLAETFEEYLCNYIAIMIIRVFTFIIVYIIVRTGICILAKILDIISKLPVIKQMDKTAGLILGGIQSILLLWIGCVVLMLFSGTTIARQIYHCIDQSMFLTFLYDHNILMKLILNFINGVQ